MCFTVAVSVLIVQRFLSCFASFNANSRACPNHSLCNQCVGVRAWEIIFNWREYMWETLYGKGFSPFSFLLECRTSRWYVIHIPSTSLPSSVCFTYMLVRMCLKPVWKKYKVMRIWISILFVFEVEKVQIFLVKAGELVSALLWRKGALLYPHYFLFLSTFSPEFFCTSPLLLTIYLILLSLTYFILPFSFFKAYIYIYE